MKIHTNFLRLLLATLFCSASFAQQPIHDDAIKRIIENNELDSLKILFQPKDTLELEKSDIRSALQDALFIATENDNVAALDVLLPLQKDPVLWDKYLWDAVYAGKAKAADFWINEGADVDRYYHWLYDYMYITNRRPLMVSAVQGNLELSKILLFHGADVNKPDVSKKTPLFFAAESGNLELVKLLVEQGADIRAVDYRNKNVLMHAAYHGRYNIVEYLLSKDFQINATDDYKRTALMMPSMYYFDEMVENRSFIELEESAYQTTKLLVEKGANVNAKDFEGMTALMFAVSNGYLKVVKLLLEHGANLEQKNDFGDTAATFFNTYYSNSYGEYAEQIDQEMKSLLNIKQGNEYVILTPKRRYQMFKDEDLLNALSKNDIREVRKAIDAGASFYLDWEPEYMGSILHRALEWGVSLPILQLLVEKGAFVNDVNHNRTTALMRAAMANDLNAARFFIKRGADVNLKNRYGNTALIFAAKEGNVKMIDLLLSHGANINVIANHATALDMAQNNSRTDAVKFLKSKGGKTLEELEGENK